MQATDIEQSVENYVLVRRMGTGSMGPVYEARHKEIERRVAIKILHKDLSDDPQIIQRFTNEARIVNIIGHAGLVSISESGQTKDGSRYIVMEYVDGVTLRDYRVHHGGRLPIDQVLRITRQVASTLAAAHEKQIVHRDLKPANIMLVRDQEASESNVGAPSDAAPPVPETLPEKLKILDFGIAKITNDGIGQTRTGIAMGTPTYMSPEQCRSGRNAVDRSDVYALGIIAYELIAGAPPFQGGAAVLMALHMREEPAPLATQAPHTPPALAKLIHSMLAKSPSDRPSAAEVARLLAEMSGVRATASQAYDIVPKASGDTTPSVEGLGDSGIIQDPNQSALHGVPLRLRGKLVLAAAAFLLALGSLLGLLVWTLARQPAPQPPVSPHRPKSLPLGPIGQAAADAGAADPTDGGSQRDAASGKAGSPGTAGTPSATQTAGAAGGKSVAPKAGASKPGGVKGKKKKKAPRRSTK